MIQNISKNHIKSLFYPLFLFLASFLLATVIWINVTFNNPNLEQIIFHILSEKDDLNRFSQTLKWEFIMNCFLFPALVVLLFINLESHFIYFRTKIKHELLGKLLDKFLIQKMPLYFILTAVFLAFFKFSVFSFLISGTDFIKNNYEDPASIQITKNTNPRNLILIYAEGLDQVYGNKDLFKNDLLKNLNTHQEVSFNKYQQVPGISYTITGMVATQCGIPLKIISLFDINGQGSSLKKFLPETTCLGDTLKEFGYKNIFLGGAHLGFSGKGNFLKTHGYDEIYGKKEWIESGKYNESDFIQWGLNDDDLFIEAKKKLDELISKKDLFNLTILTLNTHGPFGLTKKCKENGAIMNPTDDIVRCSANEIANFIQYAKDKNYLKNTDIVVIGDHLGALTPTHQKLENIEDRGIYNSWISQNKVTKNREEITHFDMAPSILEFIGFDIKGDKYGLGYSAFFKNSQILEKDRFEILKKNIPRKSDFYFDLWNGD